jgi:putative PEP-CTERM system TPR-repeat lipoprotein
VKNFGRAAALALSALFGCGGPDPDALMASAREYMDRRDFNASVIQLKNVLQQAPGNGEARYLLGLALLEQGDPVGAQIELEKALERGFAPDELQIALARSALAKGEAAAVLERFGTSTLSGPAAQAELRALVGMARLALGQRIEAQRAFDQALKTDAANVTAQLGLARFAASGRDFAQALARLERVLETTPKNMEALLLMADVLAVRQRHDDAEKALHAAVEAAPKHPEARLALIVHVLRRGALDRAAAELAAMEQAMPRNPAAFYARAMVLNEAKKYPAAKQAALQVLKAAPEHVPSLTLAGIAALHTGALQEAESYLRKALFSAPQATSAKRLLATTHLRMGRTDTALAEAKELLAATGGEDPDAQALAAEVHLASGDLAAAVHHYERARALSPDDSGIQTRLAHARFAAGDAARAISELESASARNARDYQADLALIAAHLRQGDADRALAALVALEKKQPNHPLTHSLRGNALLLKRDFAAARGSLEHALQLQPGYLPALGSLAQLDAREGKPEAGRARYEALLKNEPNNAQALLGLATLLRLTGAAAEEIEKRLRQSVTADPASPGARLALINFYLAALHTKAALAAAQEAAAALPNNAAIGRALGTAQIAAGEPRQAASTFIRLAELAPKSPEPRVLLARAHLAAKQPEDAMRALRTALALNPDLPAVQGEIAAVYVATGQHAEALREAKAVQARYPKQPLGHVLEAEIHLAQNKRDLAERTYRAALEKFEHPFLAVRLHTVMEAAGKSAAAEALAQSWIARHPKDLVVLAYLGDRDLAAKRYERAAARFRTAVERQPDNAAALNNLAWVSHELKRPAREYAERAYRLAPGSPAIMDTLGTILADSGHAEKGLELLGRAAQLAPDAHQIRLNFAKALLKAERRPAARKELEGLARLDKTLPAQQEAARLLATF